MSDEPEHRLKSPDLCDERYCYIAEVNSVYDGDTVTCDIDLGFGIVLHKQKIRLFGINAPEMRGSDKPEGTKSRDFLREMILNKKVKLYTIKDAKGKYGRWLGVLYTGTDELGKDTYHIQVNSTLAEKGLAKFANY
jgi:micrococcal nuclease